MSHIRYNDAHVCKAERRAREEETICKKRSTDEIHITGFVTLKGLKKSLRYVKRKSI